MKLRMTYNTDPTVVEKIKQIALLHKGVFSTLQPEKNGIENYVTQEICFDNIADMNKFIYSAYMTCGYYFLVETIVYTADMF